MAKHKKERLFFDRWMVNALNGLFKSAKKGLKSKKFTRGY